MYNSKSSKSSQLFGVLFKNHDKLIEICVYADWLVASSFCSDVKTFFSQRSHTEILPPPTLCLSIYDLQPCQSHFLIHTKLTRGCVVLQVLQLFDSCPTSAATTTNTNS